MEFAQTDSTVHHRVGLPSSPLVFYVFAIIVLTIVFEIIIIVFTIVFDASAVVVTNNNNNIALWS